MRSKRTTLAAAARLPCHSSFIRSRYHPCTTAAAYHATVAVIAVSYQRQPSLIHHRRRLPYHSSCHSFIRSRQPSPVHTAWYFHRIPQRDGKQAVGMVPCSIRMPYHSSFIRSKQPSPHTYCMVFTIGFCKDRTSRPQVWYLSAVLQAMHPISQGHLEHKRHAALMLPFLRAHCHTRGNIGYLSAVLQAMRRWIGAVELRWQWCAR